MNSRAGTTQQREWAVGDRCRSRRFGEWRNGTIVALVYDGKAAMVLRDGEAVERHTLTMLLTEPVDE